MQGMSMLCALAMDYEGSERWYHELQEFGKRCGRDDAAGKQTRSRLAWLDISLPQRGVEGLTETIPAVFRLMTSKEVSLPSFSVTSALPSVMNGGKDFSVWSKRDDLLYQTLRAPVEAVLGRDGVGLADCAIAESKFEKGENITGRMLTIIPASARYASAARRTWNSPSTVCWPEAFLRQGRARTLIAPSNPSGKNSPRKGGSGSCPIWTPCSSEFPSIPAIWTTPTHGIGKKRPETPCG